MDGYEYFEWVKAYRNLVEMAVVTSSEVRDWVRRVDPDFFEDAENNNG